MHVCLCMSDVYVYIMHWLILVEPRASRRATAIKKLQTIPKKIKVVARKPKVTLKAKHPAKASAKPSVATETVPRMYRFDPCGTASPSQLVWAHLQIVGGGSSKLEEPTDINYLHQSDVLMWTAQWQRINFSIEDGSSILPSCLRLFATLFASPFRSLFLFLLLIRGSSWWESWFWFGIKPI